MTNSRPDIHQEITDHILAAMEASEGFSLPWHTTMNSGLPSNIDSGKAYQGINTIVLWLSAAKQQFESPVWGTFKQWKAKGGSVRKGEKGTRVIYYKMLPAKEGAEDPRPFPMLKAYTVFNVAQTDGVTLPTAEQPVITGSDTLAHCEAFVAQTGAKIAHSGERAYYAPGPDQIQMPPKDLFTGTATVTATEGYYSTLLHELTHWTGNKARLDRLKHAGFGSEDYAKEELIAELGAAFLCAQLGITAEPRQDHADYLASWIKVLQNDKRAIFTAAAQATKAVNFLNDLQGAQQAAA